MICSFICPMVNYGVLLSLPHLGGNIYANVIVSGLLDMCGIVIGLVLSRRMSLCRILFVTSFMGGLLCLAGGLIPGGLRKQFLFSFAFFCFESRIFHFYLSFCVFSSVFLQRKRERWRLPAPRFCFSHGRVFQPPRRFCWKCFSG